MAGGSTGGQRALGAGPWRSGSATPSWEAGRKPGLCQDGVSRAGLRANMFACAVCSEASA